MSSQKIYNNDKNNYNFMKCTGDINSQVQIYGIPQDMTVSYRPGTRFGPDSIRKSSFMLCDGDHPYYLNDITNFMNDNGNLDIKLTNIDESLKYIQQQLNLDSNKFNVFLGGEHLITLPILRKMKELHNEFYLIHFDAHFDTWKDNHSEKYGHGTFLYNAINENLIKTNNILQIGCRSPISNDLILDTHKLNMDMIYDISLIDKYLPQKIDELTQKKNINKCYITFDIDVLDPSFAPGTGTPEIGGISSFIARYLLKNILNYLKIMNIKLIGCDLVEVSPPFDNNDITSLAGATLLFDIISYYKNIFNNLSNSVSK